MTTLIDIKERQRRTWASADYGAVAARIVPMAEHLVERAGLRPGEQVLDVATGTGNAALAAARADCDVIGVDYVESLLERGRRRAVAEHVPVRFVLGDAEALPFEDDSFDAVLSCVGVMFAADQERAAAELARVCRPGGRIALANWTPESFVGFMFRTVARYVPPPAGLKPPGLWGTEERLRELFPGADLRIERRRFVFRNSSADDFADFFRDCYGPVHKAFEALDASGREALHADLVALANEFDCERGATVGMPSEYLEVLITPC
jgi:SAM-dependent methyltransferase